MGARRRVPPLPPAGEGDKGGEGKKARLPVHACAGENSPCFKDFVPNRCTFTSVGILYAMRLVALRLSCFRNYAHAQISPAPRVNILLGANAQGKTNLLEAIFTSARSARCAPCAR